MSYKKTYEKDISNIDWKKEWKWLVKEAEILGLKVELVGDNKLYDYGGMNPNAAKSMDFKFPKGKIYVDEKFNWTKRYECLRHEIDEYVMMDKGSGYFPAHEIALHTESLRSV